MSDKIEEKKVSPEVVENKQEGVKSPETAVEEKSKTLEEELKSQNIPEAINIFNDQAEKHQRDLENHGANLLEKKEFVAGIKVIGEKAKDAKGVYNEEVNLLQNKIIEAEKPLTNAEIEGNRKANEEIEKFLNDPASDLSARIKAVKFREERIEIFKKKIEEELIKKENAIKKFGNDSGSHYDEQIKFFKKTIAGHEVDKESLKKGIEKIKNDIIKKYGGRKALEKVDSGINGNQKKVNQKEKENNICSKCGKVIFDNAKFCTKCGNDLRIKDATTGQPQKDVDKITNKLQKTREFNKSGQEIDLSFKYSLEKFNQSYQGLINSERNPNIPNYLDRRVRELEEIIDNMKNDEIIDNKSISLLEEVVKNDIDDMINSMVGQQSIAELYSNKYEKSDIKKEQINESEIKLYIENYKNKIYKIREVGNRWLELDGIITKSSVNMDIGLFSSEHIKAHKLLEKAANTKNIAEQQISLMLVSHILNNIEKGLGDKKMKNALNRM